MRGGRPTATGAITPYFTFSGGYPVEEIMPSFEELLAARKAAPRPHEDVEVLLDVDASEQIAELQAQLDRKASDVRLSKDDGAAEIRERIERLRSDFEDSIVTFRFEAAPGLAWAELTGTHPPRPGVALDMNFGYDVDAVSVAAAKRWGARVDGEKTFKLTEEQWDDLFDRASGADVTALRDAIWGLNEFEPRVRMTAAKKARAERGASSH